MATYKEIFGKKVQFLSSDPPASVGQGQIWYNSTSNTFKSSTFTSAWSSSTAFPGARWNTSATGIQTASLTFGGATGPGGPTFLNTTFEGDGSSWTASGAQPISSINQLDTGTQTAALGGGGLNSSSVNTDVITSYNGTAWSVETSFPQALKGPGGAGTTTAALCFGTDGPGPGGVLTKSYNGTAWATEGALSTGRANMASGSPSETTAFAAGSTAVDPAPSTLMEEYNGTAWSGGAALSTAVAQNRGSGNSADAMSIGGNPLPTVGTAVERYDGTSWTTSPSLGTGRKNFGASSQAGGITASWVGGETPGPGSTEIYTEAAAVKTITTS